MPQIFPVKALLVTVMGQDSSVKIVLHLVNDPSSVKRAVYVLSTKVRMDLLMLCYLCFFLEV